MSYSLSVSPATTFHSPTHRSAARPKHLKPFNSMDVKILLLENVNQTGRDILQGEGYQVEALKTSLAGGSADREDPVRSRQKN